MKTHDKVVKKLMTRPSVRAEVERIEREECRAAFHAEAAGRLARMKKTGSGISAEEVFDYLRKRVQNKSATRPMSIKIK
jgi:hypothetical protein